MLNSGEHEIFLFINVKMPTIVGILTFMSRMDRWTAYDFTSFPKVFQSERWADDNERLCAIAPRLWLKMFYLERESNSGPVDR